ncbi:MAG: hypothetical protein IJJ33_05105 [Victivallales bacterium]|nr:hypothetical protein [Victivallales bacterium]
MASSILCLDGIFQDGMVLQHGKSIPVTGEAKPCSVVEVRVGEVRARSVSGEDGRFTVILPPLEPMDAVELRVENGDSKLTLQNVAVGDVILASGQSNMEFPLSACRPGPESLKAEDYSGIRFFKVPVKSFLGERQRLPGSWRTAAPELASKMSGAAFFFARALHRATGRVTGFIDASCGGTEIEAWLSRESLLALAVTREEVLSYEANSSAPEKCVSASLVSGGVQLNQALSRLYSNCNGDGEADAGLEKASLDDSGWETMLLPDSWTQSGHNHAGIFWFRRSVNLTARQAAQATRLHLGAIDKFDRTYVNGTLVGTTGEPLDMASWDKLRVYRLPEGLLQPGQNTIAVQVSSLFSTCEDGGMLGPAQEMYLEGDTPENRLSLAGLWRYRCTLDTGTEGMTCMRHFAPGANTPFHILHDNMIAPLGQFPLTAVIWYQGEADAICMARRYRPLLAELIRSWRRKFCEPSLPFLVVQLPDYHNPHYFAPFSQWALLREAQVQACQDTDADCVVTLGTGHVTQLHCPDKMSLGELAARHALARLRGETPVFGPCPKGLSLENGELRLALNPAYPVKEGQDFAGFVVSDSEGNAFPAKAHSLDAQTLVITSACPTPHALWYAWGDNPVPASLRGADGLPASPFRLSLDRQMPQARQLIHALGDCL